MDTNIFKLPSMQYLAGGLWNSLFIYWLMPRNQDFTVDDCCQLTLASARNLKHVVCMPSTFWSCWVISSWSCCKYSAQIIQHCLTITLHHQLMNVWRYSDENITREDRGAFVFIGLWWLQILSSNRSMHCSISSWVGGDWGQ